MTENLGNNSEQVSSENKIEIDPVKAELYARLEKVTGILEKKLSKLEKEHHNILKTIYHDFPGLDFIPKRLWTNVNQMLKLKILLKGKKLIDRTNISPPCYAVLSGKLTVVYKKFEPGVILEPGSICGDYCEFNGKRWKPADVFAFEDTKLAEFNSEALLKLISEENSNSQFKALISFLQDSIPGFRFLSLHSQERLARFFKERTFVPNQEIIREGAPANNAFYIREGVCRVLSGNSPLVNENLYDNTKVTLKVDRRVIPIAKKHKISGYLSKSTNSYQFHTATSKDWIGDEVLLDIEKYKYMAISRTSITAYEISKENLKKFPPEILTRFIENAKSKSIILDQRKVQLEKIVTNMYNMNPSFSPQKKVVQNIQPEQYTSIDPYSSYKRVQTTIKGNRSTTIPRFISQKSIINQSTDIQNMPYLTNSISSAYPSISKYKQNIGVPNISQIDPSILYKPQRVFLNAAALYSRFGKKASIRPAIYKPPIMGPSKIKPKTENVSPERKFSYVMPGLTYEILRRNSTFSIGNKEIYVPKLCEQERPDTPNPNFEYNKRINSVKKTTKY